MENKIRKARESAGLTQADLSAWLGIPKRTLENWEQGSRKPSPWLENLIVEKIERGASSLGKEYRSIVY